MTIADSIRALARGGHTTADIARALGIRYQHAYNVLKAGHPRDGVRDEAIIPTKHISATARLRKPVLQVTELIAAGFESAGRWQLSSEGALAPDRPLPSLVGVYAFAREGIVLYVGVATMGLAKRLYFYGRPGISQRTSQRLNGLIRSELLGSRSIEILVAIPPDLEWNGLPVHGSAGLEMGLIKRYALPWNMRGAG